MKCPNCSSKIYHGGYEKRDNGLCPHICFKDRCEYIITNAEGYQSIKMYNGDNTYWRSIHKVIYELHLTKLNGYKTVIHKSIQIHHKNGNRKDNRIQNMLLVGAKQHRQIHYKIKFKRAYKKWIQVDQFIKKREMEAIA